MLYNCNKKCCNFEIVLIRGEQKDFLKITINHSGQYRGIFLVPVPSVLLWYRYRGTLLFFGGTGTLVLFHFLGGIL